MTDTLAAPEMPPAQEANDIGGLIDKIEDELTLLRRAYAGYSNLTAILSQTQGLVKGRKRGMPIFRYKATSTGRDALDIEVDTRKIPPEYLGYVLSPMCNVHMSDMLQAATHITHAINTINGQIAAATQAAAKGANAVPVESEETQEDDYDDEE